MSDEPIVIKIEGDDTQGHASAIQWTSDDEAWIKELSDSEKQVRIRIPADDDTEGHAASATVSVVVTADDDDTEGHAISLHFPSAREANDFRRKLMATGLITATVAIGVVGGAALASSPAGDAATDAGAVSQAQVSNLGQYDVDNMGGTPVGPLQASNQGQYDVDNMGGTRVGPLQASNQGQYDVDNMGGTPVSQAQVSNLGQYDPANMGGTPQASGDQDEADRPILPNRVTPQ
jgi:hypothetical protein